MASRSLTITYLADADKVLAEQKRIDAGHGTMGQTTQKTGGIFKSTWGSVAPLAFAAAGAAAIKFGVDSVKAFQEAEQVGAQTEARIKSTGGAANVSAEQVATLAGSLSDLSGAEDDTIQASENLLLTFVKVKNEVGAGNDIFNQAEKAILDMATAMNQGAVPSAEQLQSVTIQVGKALNDPIKGLTALGRAGVQFTNEQKELITTMVESGDVMGAQKLILAELENQFGGSAKAAGDSFGGSIAKAMNMVDSLQEAVGEVIVNALEPLLPLFEDIVNALELLVPVVELAAKAFELMVSPIRTVIDLLAQGVPVTDEMTALMARTIAEMESMKQKAELAAAGVETQTGATEDNTRATRDNIDALREQQLATLALSDSFLGIVDNAEAVSEAQRELNRLERQGKEDTKAYEQAVLDALGAQISLEDAVISYAMELDKSGESQRDIIGKIKDVAAEFGIQDSEVRELVSRVKELIRQGEIYDGSSWEATATLQWFQEGNTPSEVGGAVFGQHGFHGMVARPTVFVAGEAGAEFVDITPRGRGRGAGDVIVNVNVAGPFVGSEAALARMVRDEFIRIARQNVTSGLE